MTSKRYKLSFNQNNQGQQSSFRNREYTNTVEGVGSFMGRGSSWGRRFYLQGCPPAGRSAPLLPASSSSPFFLPFSLPFLPPIGTCPLLYHSWVAIVAVADTALLSHKALVTKTRGTSQILSVLCLLWRCTYRSSGRNYDKDLELNQPNHKTLNPKFILSTRNTGTGDGAETINNQPNLRRSPWASTNP